MTSKCGKKQNSSPRADYASGSMIFLPHYDVYRIYITTQVTAKCYLFVLSNKAKKKQVKNVTFFYKSSDIDRVMCMVYAMSHFRICVQVFGMSSELSILRHVLPNVFWYRLVSLNTKT